MKTSTKNHSLKNISVVDAVKNLLVSGSATTQEDICLSLAKRGILVNQSKISRLLRKLGAVKMLNHQQEAIYSLPLEPLLPPQHSQLGQLVLDITANETMIVIRTDPGSASLIARLLDHHYQELQILGTLAGDDTLFVVPKSIKTLKKLMVSIKKVLGGE
jgi:transcriptional regulator of arginine metabolism